MPLPILQLPVQSSNADLVRLFHQSQLEWSRHLGEEIELDFGRWIKNPDLPDSNAANTLIDAFLLPNLSPLELVTAMDERSCKAGTAWRHISLNPSAPETDTQSLIRFLQQSGWQDDSLQIFHRSRAAAQPRLKPHTATALNLKVIPARASYRHYTQLMEERLPGSSQVALMHLDDSHLDTLLAIDGHQPVGCIGVLSTGEVGTVREWYVSRTCRRNGIGDMLLDRAMEISSRGMLRHVMIGVQPAADALPILNRQGFSPIGQWKALKR